MIGFIFTTFLNYAIINMEVIRLEQFRICKDCNFSGVYAIVNITKQKTYIGSSRNIKSRLTNHKAKLNNNKCPINKMQYDYNNGDKFIAYVVTPVNLRNEKYCKDDDLRYFEKKAIEEFNTLNDKYGYNTNDNSTSKLKEQQNIIYAKRNLDFYFNMFDPCFPVSDDGRKEEKKDFINKVLYTEGRF